MSLAGECCTGRWNAAPSGILVAERPGHWLDLHGLKLFSPICNLTSLRLQANIRRMYNLRGSRSWERHFRADGIQP